MRRLLRFLLIAVLAAAPLAAVSCTVDQVFVKAVDGYCEAILPEYEKYVHQDADLSDTDKEIRMDSIKGFKRLVETAKED